MATDEGWLYVAGILDLCGHEVVGWSMGERMAKEIVGTTRRWKVFGGKLKQEWLNGQHFGMCADLCVHDKNDGNPHMHIMVTMRPINGDGSWGSK